MVGAVITSQRALLVSVTLRVLAAVSLSPGPTSCLWVGPALLVTNAAQQVPFSTSETVHCGLFSSITVWPILGL